MDYVISYARNPVTRPALYLVGLLDGQRKSSVSVQALEGKDLFIWDMLWFAGTAITHHSGGRGTAQDFLVVFGRFLEQWNS